MVLAVLVLAVLAWWFDAVFAERHGFFDLKVYYGAINYWVHGHGELYDYLKPRSKYGFTYPPFAAFTMTPMALVPWPVAIVISVVATTLATLFVLDRFVAPVARRYRGNRWFWLAVTACFVAVFEPMRETMLFGQVNMLLVALVAVDLLMLLPRGSRFTGVGIGLATAVKLTPGIFIVYLAITRRWRAALVASVTTGIATLATAAVAPDTAREFWTDALWDTDRVGSLAFVSNQSLEGFVARLDPADPSRVLWLALVVAVFALWVWRVRRTAAAGDEFAGLALTGVVGCLLSPVTWVHHLVWVLPALLLVADRGLAATGRRRWWLLGFAAATYVLLSSRLVWRYNWHFGGWAVLGSNAYVYASLALLLALPVQPAGVPPEHGAEASGDVERAPVEGRLAVGG
ncbi:MAG TPA: glycosyltransferase 87 family protein [Micromonosporaceae bacterium]